MDVQIGVLSQAETNEQHLRQELLRKSCEGFSRDD